MTFPSNPICGNAFRLAATFCCLAAGLASNPAIAAESKPGRAPVTFNKDIAPIVYRHCSACHRPGEVAPFSLLSYAEVSKRADHIQTVTAGRTMPPWKPLEGVGHFANTRRLSADEIATIGSWVAQGSPEGKPADLPPPPVFAEGWQLGPPDLVVTLPEPLQVPASGRDIYQNLVLDLHVPPGKYLRAAEFRPSNRRVVHHSILFYDTTGKARERDAAEPGPGFAAVTPPGKLLPGPMSIWAPGRHPVPLSEGLSLPWPAKADLVLQLHLHPSGKPEVEQSSIGFYFTDEPPRRSLLDVVLIDRKIDIPPGEKAFHTKDTCTLPIDMEALSIFPHMHMIGKQIKVTARLPDGRVRPLLEIDDWDFNWQDLYQYAEPVRLPKGTEITLEGTHDNSADNPLNPRDPPQRVRWGEQTHDEMSIAFLNFVPVREDDMQELAAHPHRRVQMAIVPEATRAKLPVAVQPKAASGKARAARTAEALRKADRNGDGKLSVAEIVAALDNRVPAAEISKHLARFDHDGDQQLDANETAEAIKAFSRR
jgi:mono/diheme cytochrome c family protein